MVLVADYEEYASGKSVDERTELKRLLEDATAGKFDQVIVHKLDRWSRRLSDLLATVEFLESHGVAFKSATEPIDTTTALGKLFLQILGSFAEFERNIIIDRVLVGIEAKVATGVPLGRVGFGLAKNGDGVLTTDPATFGVVERIFREYTRDQLGTKAIAQGLQADGLPTPGNRPWSADGVARIIRNRSFIGDLPFRDGWLDGKHDAFIDPDVFDAAQAIADARREQDGAARTRGDFVLVGTITCGRCGGSYIGNSGKSANGTRIRYYSCGTGRRYGKSTCDGPSVNADELEALVTEALVALYADTNLFAEAIEQHRSQREDVSGPLEAELTAARTAAADKQRLLNKYQADYEAGHLEAALYSERTRTLRTEAEAAQAHVVELELQLADIEAEPVPTDTDRAELSAALARSLTNGSSPLRKALFSAVIAALEVHDIDDVRPTFRLGWPGLEDIAIDDADSATAEDTRLRAIGKGGA